MMPLLVKLASVARYEASEQCRMKGLVYLMIAHMHSVARVNITSNITIFIPFWIVVSICISLREKMLKSSSTPWRGLCRHTTVLEIGLQKQCVLLR